MGNVELSAELSANDLRFVREAAAYLEQPSFLLRAANLLGKPIETLGGLLPGPVQRTATKIVDGALQKTVEVALRTLPRKDKEVSDIDDRVLLPASRWRNNLGPAVTGAVGGFFGLAALAVELPLTTTLLLRNVAAEAARMGEDLSDPDMPWHCLSVFHLAGAGTRADGDARADRELSAMESSYYAARVSLAGMTREAVRYAAAVTAEQLAQDLGTGASPALVRFVSAVAAKFNIVVSQKLVAQAAPVMGAVGGAMVNTAFSDHFQRVARYHFGLRALERRYGREAVQTAYEVASRPKSATKYPAA